MDFFVESEALFGLSLISAPDFEIGDGERVGERRYNVERYLSKSDTLLGWWMEESNRRNDTIAVAIELDLFSWPPCIQPLFTFLLFFMRC